MIKLVSVSAAALLFCSTAMAQDMSAQPPSQGTDAQTGTTTPDMGPTTPDSGTMSPDTGTATPMPDGSTSDPSMPQGSTATPDATTPMPDGSTSSPTMQDGTMGNPTDTTGNVTPPPPTTPKDYPLCSKTVQDSCMNPSEAPKGKKRR